MRKILILGLALLLLSGCGRSAAPKDGATVSIPETATRATVSHIVAGTRTSRVVDGAALEALGDWAAALNCEAKSFAAGESPGDTDGGEVYEITLPEGEGAAFSYVILGPGDCYLLTGGVWYAVRNPSTPPVASAPLTLEAVVELASKGEALSWQDFERYDSTEIGFGLLIRRYEIDGAYQLLIGGDNAEDPPRYIRLAADENAEDYVELRTGDVAAFLGR